MKPTLKNMVFLYDKTAKLYSNSFSVDLELSFLDTFSAMLEDKIKLLEVGCGEGRISGYFANKGFAVEGIDLSKGMLSLARKSNPKIIFKKMDMVKLNYPKESFDALVAAYCLFHIPKNEVVSVLEGFNRVLKKKGKLLIVTQYSTKEKFVEFPLDKKNKMFINFMTKKELSIYLQQAGFKVKRALFRLPDKNELQNKKLCIIAEKV